MTLLVLRRLVAAIAVVCVAGMIASTVADRSGTALVFGIVVAIAVMCSMAATSVTGGGRVPPAEEAVAERVEERVRALVAQGAAEPDVRALVRDTMRLAADKNR